MLPDNEQMIVIIKQTSKLDNEQYLHQTQSSVQNNNKKIKETKNTNTMALAISIHLHLFMFYSLIHLIISLIC